MSLQPIFLLSLPRSGSTLLQRRLAAHPAIATAAEPWLMLPLLLATRRDMVAGVHDQTVMLRALEDMRRRLPRGGADWDDAIRAYAMTLYERLAGQGTRYFLDKTPRYALVARDLIRIFPQARFLILAREPPAIVQSINDSWGAGRWMVPRHEIDLFAGMEGLCAACRALGTRARLLRYEELLADPDTTLAGLFAWLGLEAEAAAEAPVLEGRMGDPRRHDDDGRVRRRTPDWRERPLNPLRRRWLERYLRWLGQERLALLGYDLDALLGDLAAAPSGWPHLASDAWRMAAAPAYHFLDMPLRREKLAAWRRGERSHVYR